MSLEKYRLVSDSKADFDNINVAKLWSTRESWQNTYRELRITQKGKPKNYIADALQFFYQGSKKILIIGLGRAMTKSVTIAEVLKRKLPSLHQVTHLSSFKVVDVSSSHIYIQHMGYSVNNVPKLQVYEPLEEGLDKVESVRYVSCIEIMLSLDTDGLDINDIGYQVGRKEGRKDCALNFLELIETETNE